MRLLTILMLAIALAGCSSHDERFEDRVPPRPTDPSADGREMAAAAVGVLKRYRNDTDLLTADALAPLARGAAVTFQAGGAPGVRSLTRHYADALLAARVSVGPAQGFFGAMSPGEADPAATSAAGIALIEAFTATGDERYRRAAGSAATAVRSGALGWRSGPRGTGVQADGGLDIALTAQAAEFLDRAADELDVDSADDADLAFETVLENQAALGNWFAAVNSDQPQSIAEWAISLNALLASPDDEGERVGVAGGGVPKLTSAVFGSSGEPEEEAFVGVALAMVTLALSPDQTDAVRVLGRAAESQREDGTVGSLDPRDPVAQSYAALAFSLRARRLLQPPTGA
jgi:hypothetical protein